MNEYTDINGKSYLSEVKTDMISNREKEVSQIQNSIDNSMIKIEPPAGQVNITPMQDINFNVAKYKNINEGILRSQTAETTIPITTPNQEV